MLLRKASVTSAAGKFVCFRKAEFTPVRSASHFKNKNNQNKIRKPFHLNSYHETSPEETIVRIN